MARREMTGEKTRGKTRYVAMGALAFTLLLLAAGCAEKQPEALPDESDTLYRGSVELVGAWSDSIVQAPDSVSAKAAFMRFCSLLDSLNFSVPPNTDLLLTEGENDTLYRELTGIKELYERKLARLGNAEPDSVVDTGPDNVPYTRVEGEGERIIDK